MATEISKRLFTVDDYHRMVDAGILSEDDRVELIRGEVLAMSPIGPRHGAAVLRGNHNLVRIVGDLAIVGVQVPSAWTNTTSRSPIFTCCGLRTTSTHPDTPDHRTTGHFADHRSRGFGARIRSEA